MEVKNNSSTTPLKENIKIKLPYEINGEHYDVEKLGEVAKKPFYSFLKRLFDIIFSLIALAFLWLPILIISVVIKISSKGTVFYSQERLGLNGEKFKIVKFRTMQMDAEDECIQWCTGDEDERIFPFGRILRKSRLDELPQFWCILKGDMSLVGPRPERECFYDLFETYIDGFKERLKVKPGLTGLAQVNGGYNSKPHEKIYHDVDYIKKRSVWMDICIIFKTIRVILTGNGAK